MNNITREFKTVSKEMLAYLIEIGAVNFDGEKMTAGEEGTYGKEYQND